MPYYKLFSLADSFDCLLMFFGTVAAVGNGICMPLMALLFGELINTTGKPVSTTVMVHGIYEVSLKFVYLALGSAVASFIRAQIINIIKLNMPMFAICQRWLAGPSQGRQATRIRSLYLKTILRQEIGFFDKETSTGEIVGRISSDTILIQDAMGEKV
ncbi:hypothetical protein Pint_24170 [Pistacia integerrima]|uniref:Uncharacterized protein n=1 Tax=Pistacia integerrima TaxID=434235 RepID=A0ACC0YER4_9ROSI|nr:hypothetical protein Pint_24170 [Pistacia integerrima]